MNSFLYSVAETFYNNIGEGIKDYTFVFPSRRAQLFFTKHLSEITDKPIFSPTLLTIDNFVSQLSGYALVDKIEMLFSLYSHYKKITQTDETFDDFLYWGEILLNDFDDVDKYLVDASKLFSNIYELKEIDAEFSDILTFEQKKFLQRFATNFNYEKNDSNKEKFIALWQILYDLYSALRNELKTKKCAYNGMMLRSIIEDIESGKKTEQEIRVRYNKIVFVGFNILSYAEEKLMMQLQDMQIADFYWDDNTPLLNDRYSLAGNIMSGNIKKFPSQYLLNQSEVQPLPTIEVTAIPSNIGQTKYAGSLVSNLIKSGCDNLNTVIVLPDESLLMPMLHTIPAEVESVNVTMGYPLNGTSMMSLFKAIYDMQIKTTTSAIHKNQFYYKNVVQLLQQPFVQQMHYQESVKLLSDISQKNIVYISKSDLPEELQYLFSIPETKDEAIAYIYKIIDAVEDKIGGGTEDEDINREFLYYYRTIITRLEKIISNEDIAIKTLFRLIEKMSIGVKVPFNGEPLSGLQIMGVLETRALDFDNVIILSMNEGVFPADSRTDTFIPYNVRKGFGMATYEQRDGMAEYYFYRLISKAKNVYLTYDTRSEGLKAGDVSRFVYQLKYQYLANTDKLTEKSINYNIKSVEQNTISIKKDESISDKLNRYSEGGDLKISASAINTYIDCPLKFYFTYVENIKENDDVSEDLDAATFGTIYHAVMQQIYTPYEGKVIDSSVIEKIKQNEDSITKTIEDAFKSHYYKTTKQNNISGRLYMRFKVIEKMVYRTLELDNIRAPFTMLKNELMIDLLYPLSNGKKIRVKGLIDRLDKTDKSINIIDYKSGKAIMEFTSVDKLFSPKDKDRCKAVLQLLFYVELIRLGINETFKQRGKYKDVETLIKNAGITTPDDDIRIIPGLYVFGNYFADNFEWQLRLKADKVIKAVEVAREDELMQNYLANLDSCLISIFDKETPFEQTKNTDICKYCPFAEICRR